MRIIAGEFRGRRLVAPKGLATRPTTDRVREAWFSILGRLEGVVVDLYAGTGALGFEAISRGASHAIFVESARPAQQAIIKNAESLGITNRITLLATTVEAATKRLLSQPNVELLLTDPPWTDLITAERALQKLLLASLLTETGRMVVGHPKSRPIALAPDSGLVIDSQRSWGDSGATFLSRAQPVASL